MLPSKNHKMRKFAVPVSGGELLLEIVDAPNAVATLLCLHGWTLDARSFEWQRELVDAGVSVVSFDRRGFGNSQLAPDFTEELNDLNAIVACLGCPVLLYGVSQGARLALRAVVKFPSIVAGAVVQGGHVDGARVEEPEAEAIPFGRYRDWLAEGELSLFREDWLNHPLMARGVPMALRADMARLIDRYRGRDLLTPGALPVPMDIRDALALSTKPILVVIGAEESASRRAHGELLGSCKMADVMAVPEGGHLCNVTHPDIVNRGISRWIHSRFG